VRPWCWEQNLPPEMQIKNCTIDREKLAIECHLEIVCGEAPIVFSNTVYSGYPVQT